MPAQRAGARGARSVSGTFADDVAFTDSALKPTDATHIRVRPAPAVLRPAGSFTALQWSACVGT
jgi:hypothetical protein